MCGEILVAQEVVPALGHDWNNVEPAWSWTGNDSDGYSSATATFACLRVNCDYEETETDEEIDCGLGTDENEGYTVYTATVSFNGVNYTDTKTVINQYTITFLDGDTVITTITQNYGTAVTPPEDPEKAHHTFTGWDSTIPETMPANDLTITAQWTELTEYYIVGSFDGCYWEQGVENGHAILLVTNPENADEMMADATFAENDEFKVIKVVGGDTEHATWYPSVNYLVGASQAGDVTVYFREDGQGGDGWHYGYIYIAVKATPEPTFTHSEGFSSNKFIYRVGNSNTVALGKIFAEANPTSTALDGNNVIITVTPGDGSNVGANPAYTKNASDWTQSTLKFTGTGPIKLSIQYGEDDIPYAMDLEVVAAKNVTAYSELSGSCVLLNDIAMSSNGKWALSGGTLYGNGFTFDVTAGKYGDSNGYENSNYVISLTNAKLDNVRIVGAIYPEFGVTRTDDYNFPCVLVNGGNCTIANCYISNCASPVRVRSSSSLMIENTTLRGGSFCNMDVRSGSRITINGLTTINQLDMSEGDPIGLGIVVWYEGANGLESITILNNSLTQYNNLAKDQKDHTVGTASFAYNNMFTIDSKFIYDDGTTQWVNAGILSLDSRVGSSNVTTQSGYDWQTVTMLGRSGNLCTKLAAAPQAGGDYESDHQYAVEPGASFEYPTGAGKKNYKAKTDGDPEYCYWDSQTSTVVIGFAEGGSKAFNPNILTVTKNGKTITPTVKLDNGSYQAVSSSITISTEGDHTLTYQYTDPYNFRLNDLGAMEAYSVTYTKTVKLSVTVAIASINPATFDFNGNGYKTVTANNTTYVMPNVSATVTNSIGSTTVGGKTIYYPIVFPYYSTSETGSLTQVSTSAEPYKMGNMFIWCQIFDGVVTITDYDVNGNSATYGSTNTNMADGKLTNADPNGLNSILTWSSASSPDVSPKTNGGKLYYRTTNASSNARSQGIKVMQYQYVDNAGNTYRYYVGYYFPEKEKGSCIAAGTMITMADGTQKAVEDITTEDNLLVWDFYNGAFTTSPVAVILDHGLAEVETLRLHFSDDASIDISGWHGFFDANENKFVQLSSENYENYIGHEFIRCDQGDGGHSFSRVTLSSGEVFTEETREFLLISAYHYDYIANGLLNQASVPYGEVKELYNYFDVGGEMTFDKDAMEWDIETYGLYDYDVFKEVVTYEQYVGLNLQYLKISVGKGYLTLDALIDMLKEYVAIN